LNWLWFARGSSAITESFSLGSGMGCRNLLTVCFMEVKSFSRPGLCRESVSSWISRFERCQSEAQTGARMADVGCGKGGFTILMANRHFLNSRFFGFD